MFSVGCLMVVCFLESDFGLGMRRSISRELKPKPLCEFCVNYKRHHAVIEPQNTPKGPLDFVFLVLTQYGQGAFERRQFIRRTWANQTHIKPLKGTHFFALGEARGFSTSFLRFFAARAAYVTLMSWCRRCSLHRRHRGGGPPS